MIWRCNNQALQSQGDYGLPHWPASPSSHLSVFQTWFQSNFLFQFQFSAKPDSLCLQCIHILQIVLSSFVTFPITVNSFLVKTHNSREQIWYLIIFSYLKVVRGIEKVGGVHCKIVNNDYLSSNKYLNASVVPISRSLFEGLLMLTLSGRILNTCAQHTLYMREYAVSCYA